MFIVFVLAFTNNQSYAQVFEPTVKITAIEFVDTFGNLIDRALLGQYPGVRTHWDYKVESEQDFLYMMQVKDEKGFVESLEMHTGTLHPDRHFDPSFLFIPESEGTYTATVFVWESLETPIPISYPASKTIKIEKTNCDVHPLSDKQYQNHLVSTDSIMMSPHDLAQLLASSMKDEITDTRSDNDDQIIFDTLKGSITINKDSLASPKAVYVITKNHPFDDEKYQERAGFREFIENMGYEFYGIEHWGSIGSPQSQKMYLSQSILGYDAGQSHSTKFFWSPDGIRIELDRWYQNASCIKFNVSEEQAKRIAYNYIASESKKNPDMIERGMEPSWSERVSLKIINDAPVYVLTAGIGPGHNPNQDSPNCTWVMVDVFTGKVVGWEFCFFDV